MKYNWQMETYITSKPFNYHPSYETDREDMLASVDIKTIDPPLRTLVKELNRLPFIFTLQCCHGHFVTGDHRELLNPGEQVDGESLVYRLAYFAICIADNESGWEARERLMELPVSVDPENVQFGSAEWFWDQWPNSYVVQVMPHRFRDLDKARISYLEACELEKIRDKFFVALNQMVGALQCCP